MAVKYSETVRKGLVFGFSPLRWMPIFVVDIVFFSLFVVTVLTDNFLIASLLGGLTSPANLATSGLGGLVAMVVVWFVVRLWVTGGIIHQTVKEREFVESWRVALKSYPSLLGAMVIVLVISLVVGLVPYLSSLLSVLVGVVFFFPLQAVIIKKRSAWKALKDAYSLFWKYRDPFSLNDKRFMGWALVVILGGLLSVSLTILSRFSSVSILTAASLWLSLSVLAFLLFHFNVFRMWLLVAALSGVIAVIFSLPMLVVGMLSLTPNLLLLGGTVGGALLLYFLSNPGALLLTGSIFLVGTAIATAFTLKVQTEFYLRFRKRLGIF